MKNVILESLNHANWTAHAMLRKQQRGIKQSEVRVVFDHGDREVPAGSNCYHLAISKYKLKAMQKEGCVCPKLAEKCKRLVILTDGQSIITTFRISH